MTEKKQPWRSPFGEPKVKLKARLENKGRWREFCGIRESIKADLVASGVPHEEAVPQAWTKAAEQFPLETKPAPHADIVAPAKARAAIKLSEEQRVQALADRRSSKREDAEWVYQNMNAGPAAVDWESCPGLGAKHLLEWANGRPDLFYKDVLPKLIGKGTEDEKTDFGPTELIDEILTACAAELPPEPGVSQVDPGDGGN